ncbi:MAG TPA: superoxide dismutase [Dictyobacter sp.]|jgi:Fe-Mn family superoxide dismutase|nr:superoxide dismutase [Dictyobacter sp.]
MAFVLPTLSYEYHALEPYIDTQTMRLHHDKHHGAYVANLNAALEGHPFANIPIEAVLRRINELPESKRAAVRNHGGGHINHTIYWETLVPGGSKKPIGECAIAIEQTFRSVNTFQTMFNDAGNQRMGSGWVWLVLNQHGELEIITTENQDSPLTEDLAPILGNDVWEHAYYLTYRNDRSKYLQAWWNVVNWDIVSLRYIRARKAQHI